MTEGIKRGSVIAGLTLLAGLAVAGWTRNPAPPPADQSQVVTDQAVPVQEARLRTRYVRSYASASVVRHHRSTRKSLAIIGGTAGTGAAIGALAGGGRGAAIGALSGGAAGFVYDRLTRNR